MATPTTAQISINISGKEIWINPPNFVSLSMTRLAGDTCNSFTLQVLDTTAFEVEYSLLNNTGGEISFSYNDYTAERYTDIKFNGYILSISDSFVDDRMMLTLEGFVGISFSDKFERLSFAWNIVPKFNWSDIFTDSVTMMSDGANDESDGDNFWENIGNSLKNLGGQVYSGWKMLKTIVSDGFNVDDVLYRSLSVDPNSTMETVINNIKIDKAGNYYLPSMKLNKKNDMDSVEFEDNIQQSGTYLIPMRPSSIIKLIARGGNYSELLENDFEKYKGTSFYNGKSKVSKLDWLFIQKWYKKLGKFEGCGWKCSDSNIQLTDLKETDLTQTKQSFLQYINDVLVPNSTITEIQPAKSKIIKTEEKKKYNVVERAIDPNKANATKTVETTKTDVSKIIKTNFMLSFDTDGTVHYKRIDITNSPVVQEEYFLYGKDTDIKNIQNPVHGNLIAFSAKLDVLTSMITNGLDTAGDISNLNLITGTENKDYKSEVDTTAKEENELTAFNDWGNMTVTVSKGSSSSKSGNLTLSGIQKNAEKQCYRANATIEGPCQLSPQDYIKITTIPKSDGVLKYHHTTGTYYILKIEEVIESGRHYSNLELVKNVGSMGNTGETVVTKSYTTTNEDSASTVNKKYTKTYEQLMYGKSDSKK